jgi:hypothetical protein
MALMHIPLEQIEEKHLQSLIETEAAESLWIEYKRDTYGSSDNAKAEFLADISSFANSSGGDLVIGMEAKKGVPFKVNPFTEPADSELLRLDQMAQNGLQLRMPKLPKKMVQIASGGSVLIIRAPRSYNAPHRVIFKNKNRFWARSSVGKYGPDVDQLRELFTRAPQLADRIRDFRMQRIAHIAAGDTPLPLADGCLLVLHVIPFSAFDLRPPFSLQNALDFENWPKFSYTYPVAYRINFDGFLTLTDADIDKRRHLNYVQVFRTGAIELVTSPMVTGQNWINAQTLDAFIVKSTRNFATALHKCGAEPPLAVMVSLTGVRSAQLNPGFDFPETVLIDRDQLHCAEVILDDVPSGDPDCAKKLRPMLDQIANAAGIPTSVSFDQAGNFILGQGGHLP